FTLEVSEVAIVSVCGFVVHVLCWNSLILTKSFLTVILGRRLCSCLQKQPLSRAGCGHQVRTSHIHTKTHTNTYTHTHKHSHTRTRTHTHTHTHTLSLSHTHTHSHT